jgi:hypothetical protein
LILESKSNKSNIVFILEVSFPPKNAIFPAPIPPAAPLPSIEETSIFSFSFIILDNKIKFLSSFF